MRPCAGSGQSFRIFEQVGKRRIKVFFGQRNIRTAAAPVFNLVRSYGIGCFFHHLFIPVKISGIRNHFSIFDSEQIIERSGESDIRIQLLFCIAVGKFFLHFFGVLVVQRIGDKNIFSVIVNRQRAADLFRYGMGVTHTNNVPFYRWLSVICMVYFHFENRPAIWSVRFSFFIRQRHFIFFAAEDRSAKNIVGGGNDLSQIKRPKTP